MKYWIFLAVAILFEVAGTTSMKFSHGFENWIPTVLVFIFYVISFSALILALYKIDLSVAYAVWAGVGTVLIAIIGIVYFNENAGVVKIASIALIAMGVVGVHLSGGSKG